MIPRAHLCSQRAFLLCRIYCCTFCGRISLSRTQPPSLTYGLHSSLDFDAGWNDRELSQLHPPAGTSSLLQHSHINDNRCCQSVVNISRVLVTSVEPLFDDIDTCIAIA